MTSVVTSPAGLLLVLLIVCLLLRKGEAEWLETAKLIDPDGETGDFFGWAVAIDNGILAVSSSFDAIDLFDDAGSVTIFELVEGVWSAEATLTASDADTDDSFGYSVAVRNGTVAVGAYLEDDGGTWAGAVYIYGRDEGGRWTEQAKLVPRDVMAFSQAGFSLSIHENTLIAGAPAGGDSDQGSVFVYTLLDGRWTEEAQLRASSGSLTDDFGFAVAIGDETLVVGAWRDSEVGVWSGAAYIFEVAADGLWTEQTKLTPTDGNSMDQFGMAVAIEEDTVYVGSLDTTHGGGVYIFQVEGGSWTEHGKLIPSEFAPWFGRSFAIRDEMLVVGAFGIDANTGAAYLFERKSGAWSEGAKLVASDRAFFDKFGDAVALDDGVVVASAPSDTGTQGSVYVFECSDSESPSMMPSESLPTEQPSEGPSPVGPVRRLFCIIFFFLCRD